MAARSDYYYRGTTRGWKGNPVLEGLEITCVTTDPLIATLFAIECRNHGQAAVLIASKRRFAIAGENFFAIEESAVNLRLSPEAFEESAEIILDVDESLRILEELGFAGLPARIPRPHLQDVIFESFNAGQRLSLAQIREFDRRVMESLG